MQFTFGIPTNKSHGGGDNVDRVNKIIDSIEIEGIPEYEVLLVGDCPVQRKNTRSIEFDESIKSGWISRKKNVLSGAAKYENIVFLHDYLYLVPGWYKGWLAFGDSWDVAMNVIQNLDGNRFRDWVSFDDPNPIPRRNRIKNTMPEIKSAIISPYLPEYTYTNTRYMYISGSYWLAKKSFMLANPIDERFVWGEPEDIEWSLRIRDKYNYRMNTLSAVRCMKQKDNVWPCISLAWYLEQSITANLAR